MFDPVRHSLPTFDGNGWSASRPHDQLQHVFFPGRKWWVICCRQNINFYFPSLQSLSVVLSFCFMLASRQRASHFWFVAVDESDQDTVTFLYELKEGGAARSYGLNVAKLAGLPDDIVKKASAKSRDMEDIVARKRCGDCLCFMYSDVVLSLSITSLNYGPKILSWSPTPCNIIPCSLFVHRSAKKMFCELFPTSWKAERHEVNGNKSTCPLLEWPVWALLRKKKKQKKENCMQATNRFRRGLERDGLWSHVCFLITPEVSFYCDMKLE